MRPIQTLKTRFDAARAVHDAGDLRGARAALLTLANDRVVADDGSLPAGALDHALAAVQARLGHAGLAADYARAANRQRRRALLAGGAAFPDMRAALGPAALAPAAVAAWRRLPMALDEPVFLLGLADPGRRRLIDHLAAHPGVRLITEPALIGQVVTAAPALGADAAALAHLEPTEAAALRADYLRRRADLAGGGDAAGAGVIDAGAHNMVHLAWIVRLFPLARLVIFTRHPADHCLAPWLTRPAPADDDPLLTRLGDIVGFYDHAMALWAAADAALPLNVHQFSLEEALADPPGAFARLYQFLALPAAAGLPARLAADPDDAPGRHRRFRALLAPHRGRLAPWVAALGLAD